jgi:hypothetical protein
LFDKTFLFDRKSIKQEKGRIKEKNRAEGEGLKVFSKENGLCGAGLYKLISVCTVV